MPRTGSGSSSGPRIPGSRTAYKRLMTIAMAGLGAFGCALLGISWREYRSRRVDSADEVVHGLGLRLVGTLPALPARPRRRSRTTPDASRACRRGRTC